MRRLALAASLAVLGFAVSPPESAQDFSKVEVRTEKVADGIYMLLGRGGNIGLSVGADGVFMVDDQFAPLSDKIKAAIAALTDQPVRFLINTHWHFDHADGNEAFATGGATIVAHENVRKTLAKGGGLKFIPLANTTVPPKTGDALPVVTFTDSVTFHMNGQTIDVVKLPDSHTNGDSVVRFREANVMHVGDVVRTGYPFIDVVNGGSLQGTIDATNVLISMADSDTKIMSGHAPVIGRDALQDYRTMLEIVQARISALIGVGMSVDDIVEMSPLKDLNDRWGKGFIRESFLIKAVYADLTVTVGN